MQSEDGYGAPEERYSVECVEAVFCDLRLYGVLGSCLEPDVSTHRSIPKQKAATSVAAAKETTQLKASLRDASRSITATTAPLNKAQKAVRMSSPRYVSDSEETNATAGVGTLGTRTTSFGW
jgi:hypothetical protein